MGRITLRITLILISLTGIFAAFVLIFPWSQAVKIYGRFGIDLPSEFEHPYLEYLTYLGAALSVMVGCLYLMAGIWPEKYSNLITFLGGSLLFIGVIVLFHGIRLDLPPWPFYPDPIISFICGSLILLLRRSATNLN